MTFLLYQSIKINIAKFKRTPICAQNCGNRFVLSSIGKTQFKTPAIYNFIEVLPRTFLTTIGVQSWRQEDNFAKEPVRRKVVAIITNTAYLSTN